MKSWILKLYTLKKYINPWNNIIMFYMISDSKISNFEFLQ